MACVQEQWELGCSKLEREKQRARWPFITVPALFGSELAIAVAALCRHDTARSMPGPKLCALHVLAPNTAGSCADPPTPWRALYSSGAAQGCRPAIAGQIIVLLHLAARARWDERVRGPWLAPIYLEPIAHSSLMLICNADPFLFTDALNRMPAPLGGVRSAVC